MNEREKLVTIIKKHAAHGVMNLSSVHACCCMGPRPGETLCPCAKRAHEAKAAMEVLIGVRKVR